MDFLLAHDLPKREWFGDKSCAINDLERDWTRNRLSLLLTALYCRASSRRFLPRQQARPLLRCSVIS